MANLRSTPWAFERTPGIVAVGGATFGAALLVLVLFTAVLTEEPPWVLGWGTACAATLLTSAALAWQVPSQLAAASRLGLVAATAGLALASPALSLWVRATVLHEGLVDGDFFAFAIASGTLCACYLSLLAADLVRRERIALDEHRARRAARLTMASAHSAVG